jgi:hypothetical protein
VFLQQFLRVALGQCRPDARPISTLELIVGDLDSAVIYREKDNIDLLIEIPPLKLVVVVENKIGASVSDGQLQRYESVIQARYSSFRHLFVLLTPEGDDPDGQDWVQLSYSELANVIDGLVQDASMLAPDIEFLLKHYSQMLRRHVVEDQKLVDLARQVYERYKDALDFIFKHQPDSLIEVVREHLDADSQFLQDRHAPAILRFSPREWQQVPICNSCPQGSWTHSQRDLLFEVKAFKDSDRLSLGLVSGPADAEIRNSIYSMASSKPKTFVGLVKPMGAKWATIFACDLLPARAAADMELGQKRATIKENWAKFVSHNLPELKASLAKLSEEPNAMYPLSKAGR